MKNTTLKTFLPHILAIIAFIGLGFLYALPVVQGKRLAQHDAIQAQAAAQEVVQFHEKTGEWSAWANNIFSGMPAYMIAGDYPTSISSKLGRTIMNTLPNPVGVLFLMMLGGYILLLALRTNTWQAIIGAILFAFGSFSLLSIEAGHTSKMIAIAYAPAVIAGVIWAFRGKYWLGGAVTALAMALELYGNHPQITYYLALALGIYVVIESFVAIKEKKVIHLSKALTVLLFAATIAVGTHTTRLWNTLDYSKQTIRGKSELTPANKQAVVSDGLDKDYAFRWSYGIPETLTLLIPNFYGGASSGGLDKKSETYQMILGAIGDQAQAQTIVEKQIPAYWGTQPFVGGPAYAGAILCFLFVLGVFVVSNRIKWWLLTTSLLYLMFAWGKNFGIFNNFMFDYFPYFNKFRAATMTFSLIQLLMATLAVLALKTIADQKSGIVQLKRPILWALALTAGLCTLLALVPSLAGNFRSSVDTQLQPELVKTLVADREAMLRSDALRSLLLILLATALLVVWVMGKVKDFIFYPVLCMFLLFDLFSVDKRYFNNSDFVSKAQATETFQPTAIDEQILKDKDPDFRVFDLSTDAFNDASTAYLHKSIGGYHGAKMRRYQELIENHLSKNNIAVLAMLNTKYFIVPDQKTQTKNVMPNPDACGNAWFVKEYAIVPNANAEIKALEKFNPKQIAFIDKRFATEVSGLKITPDTSNLIQLISYKPNELVYKSTASSEQLAIFSEIYYNVRNEWKVNIDGKDATHFRANYVLRAMRIPAGKHTITFRFDPISVRSGHTADLIASVLLVLFIGLAIWSEYRK